MLFRSIGFLLFITLLVLYATYPQWMARFRLPFPIWLRCIGVCLGLASLGLLVWVQDTLGRHWSTGLVLREEHTLVTTGPYRWVRHPMYTALFAFMIALALVSANWLVVLAPVGGISLFLARIPKEEGMMIEEFGDEYRAYMERTGRLLPRLFG